MYGFTNGVIVSTVTPNGGAAKAGIQPGDVIVSIDGRNIKDGDDLVNDISARKVGSTVKLGYLRDGKAEHRQRRHRRPRQDLRRPRRQTTTTDDNARRSPTPDRASSASPSRPFPPPVAQKTGIKGGVIVTSVRPGSFADEINLAKGAIITAINKKPVTDEASYRPSSPPSNPRTTSSSSSTRPSRRAPATPT